MRKLRISFMKLGPVWKYRANSSMQLHSLVMDANIRMGIWKSIEQLRTISKEENRFHVII